MCLKFWKQIHQEFDLVLNSAIINNSSEDLTSRSTPCHNGETLLHIIEAEYQQIQVISACLKYVQLW